MDRVGQRIAILGVTGSGKSTLARQLSVHYGYPCIELDNLFWKPNWEASTDTEFAEKVKQAIDLNDDSWVVDGNYTRVGATIIWQRADTLIWLDYPLRVNFWRLWKRTWGRFLRREKLWDAQNTESLWKHFVTRESLFLWAWQSHPKKRIQYTELFASEQFSHCTKIRLKSPEATDQWLEQLMHETD